MNNLVTNFDEVKSHKMFNPLGYNEFFLKAVTHEVSGKTGNKMWILHFLPLAKDNKGFEKEGKVSYPDAIKQYIVFGENGQILNGSFVEPLLMTLVPNTADMREILKKSVGNKKVTLWISQKLEDYTKRDGSIGYKLVMDRYSKQEPTHADKQAAKSVDTFNEELKEKAVKADEEEALSGDDIDDIF